MSNLQTEQKWQKYISNRVTAYTPESYAAYDKAASALGQLGFMEMQGQKPDPSMVAGLVEAAAAAREQLVTVVEPESVSWYIWHGNVAKAADADQYDYSKAFDYPEFEPFLLPYLLPDQSRVKGNLIVIAGGGYAGRMNAYEGYPVAERFNELGYNAYVLQRRVAPYLPEDSMMDLARSIRYLRAMGPEKGIGGLDCIGAAGFSGGSSTILGQLALYYGDILPTALHPDYIPDEIDHQSADMDFALCIYGPAWKYDDMSGHYETDNPNLPPIFICAGSQDDMGAAVPCTELFRSLNDRTATEIHLFAGAGHGFGIGPGMDAKVFRPNITHNVTVWPMLADAFIDYHTGKKPVKELL